MRSRPMMAAVLTAIALMVVACGSSEKPKQPAALPISSTTSAAAKPDKPPVCAQSDLFGYAVLNAEQKSANAAPDVKTKLTADLDKTSSALKTAVPAIEKDVTTRTDLRKKLIAGQALTPEDYQADKAAADAISKWYASTC